MRRRLSFPVAALLTALFTLLPGTATAQELPPVAEAHLTLLPLAGPAASRNAEISGMAWFDDLLVLLPQWPEFAGDGSSLLFALPRTQIEARLDGRTRDRLTPMTLTLDDAALRDALPTFGGYEAIAFNGKDVYLTIEAWAPNGSMGWLVRGWVERDAAIVHVEPETLTPIQPQTGKSNVSDETIVLAGDSLLTIYELNGGAIVDSPVGHHFGLDGAPLGTVAFPNIEYRITDATPLDEDNRFWAVNFYYPLEGIAVVEPEPLAQEYGVGPSHALQPQVERLVEFAWDGTQVVRTDTPPIQLRLALLARNWEGIARLGDRGFLIVTDKFPTTLLGFVAAP